MKIKKLAFLLAVLVLIFSFAGCSGETNDLEEPSSDNDIIEPEDEPVTPPEVPNEPEPPAEPEKHSFMSFEEITELGYYPLWMQPHTYVVYDENGIPEITEGGILTEEDVEGRDDIETIGYIDTTNDDILKISANTKVEYDLHGFMQNIYFLWPDGSYNLSPPVHEMKDAAITYYEDIANFGYGNGVTVSIETLPYDIFDLVSKMSVAAESTSKPMDFPRYIITFTYDGTEHSINIDRQNIFTSTMLDRGNYISFFGNDYYSEAEEIFNKAQ